MPRVEAGPGPGPLGWTRGLGRASGQSGARLARHVNRAVISLGLFISQVCRSGAWAAMVLRAADCGHRIAKMATRGRTRPAVAGRGRARRAPFMAVGRGRPTLSAPRCLPQGPLPRPSPPLPAAPRDVARRASGVVEDDKECRRLGAPPLPPPPLSSRRGEGSDGLVTKQRPVDQPVPPRPTRRRPFLFIKMETDRTLPPGRTAEGLRGPGRGQGRGGIESARLQPL